AGPVLPSLPTRRSSDLLEVRGASNLTGINFPDVIHDPTLHGEDRNVLRWFDTDGFRNPADWTVGNVGRSLPKTRGPGMFAVNLRSEEHTSELQSRFELV